MSAPSPRQRLDDLKIRKAQAQKAIHADAYKYKQAPNSDVAAVDENDKLDWSAHQWEVYSKKERAAPGSGFKNQSNLAHATYLKELSKTTPDLEKYQKNSALETDAADFVPSQADAAKIAESLREASERKQSRRSGTADGGQYMTEKNRQFNMKLDREYGTS